VLERHGVAEVGEGATSLEVLRLAGYHRPSLVVLEHELPGTTGLEAARELLASDPAPVVILISADPHHLSPAATAEGVQTVVPHRDLDALEEAIAGAVVRLRTGERRSGRDRRSGVDRRRQQDWSKVWSQRRSGVERRQVLRRAADREAAEAAGSAAGDPPAEPGSRPGP
jgi:DNA-binding NarL/FixJ family response regulator